MENYSIHNREQPYQHKQQVPQNQASNYYPQTLLCSCNKLFKSQPEFQEHKNKQHPDNYFTTQIVQQAPDQWNKQHKHNNERQQNRSININKIASNNFPNQFSQFPLSNLNQKAQRRQQYFPQGANNQSINQQVYPQINQISNSTTQNKRPQQTQQQRQLYYKYYQNYYQQKMRPFYQIFDVQPYKSSSRYKSKSQMERNHILHRRNRLKDHEYSIQTSLQDFSNVQQQLYLRMVPISNGISQFVELIDRQNREIFKGVNIQYKEMVKKILTQKIYHLNQLNLLNQQRNNYGSYQSCDKNQDFMNSDLIMALADFMNFILKTIKPTKIWVIEQMMLIVMDTLIYNFDNPSKQRIKSLKVNDFYEFFHLIRERAQQSNKASQITISHHYFPRLLTWICQWITIKQYMFNKFNTDFADSLLNQVNQINAIYKDNVNKYMQCAQKRKVAYLKKYKRKMIEKERIQHDRQQKNRTKISDNIKSVNQHKFSHQQNDNSIYPEISQNKQSVKKSIPHQEFSFNHHQTNLTQVKYKRPQYDPFKQKINNGENKIIEDRQRKNSFQFVDFVNAPNFNPEKNVINYNETVNPEYYNNFRNKQKYIVHNQEQREDDYLNNESYPSQIRQSQYVSYFSPQFQQLRKREKEAWKVRVGEFKEILSNPYGFKKEIRQNVPKQLNQIEQLLKIRRAQSKAMHAFLNRRQLSHHYQKETIIFYKNNNSESHYNDASNLQQQKPEFKKERNEEVYSKQEEDPFIIKRNYRKRRQLENYFNERPGNEKYLEKSQQFKNQKVCLPEISNQRRMDQMGQNEDEFLF